MSTLVKGDKIKIPILSEDYVLESDLEGYDIKIYKDYVLNAIQNSIAINMSGQIFTKSVNVDDEENVLIVLNSIHDANNTIVSISLKSDFKDEEYYHFVTSFTIIANSSIPNWNAEEGEAGYIENKPFKKIIFNGVIESDNTIVYNYNTISSTSAYISYEGIEILHFTEYGEEQEITLNYPNIKIYWNGGDRVVITNLSDDPIGYIKELISVYGYERQLPSSSIDNGVIKTFPQTLTDTDKNQALANLGIDPVVWKYMCEPYIIESESYLPSYLHQLLVNNNPLILNLCKIKVVTEAYDEYADVNRPIVHFCTPIAYKFNDEPDRALSLQCITFYDNTYHTYYVDIDELDGQIYDITEIVTNENNPQ